MLSWTKIVFFLLLQNVYVLGGVGVYVAFACVYVCVCVCFMCMCVCVYVFHVHVCVYVVYFILHHSTKPNPKFHSLVCG